MYLTLDEMGTSFQVLKASLETLTASLNSSWVVYGTLATSSNVA